MWIQFTACLRASRSEGRGACTLDRTIDSYHWNRTVAAAHERNAYTRQNKASNTTRILGEYLDCNGDVCVRFYGMGEGMFHHAALYSSMTRASKWMWLAKRRWWRCAVFQVTFVFSSRSLSIMVNIRPEIWISGSKHTHNGPEPTFSKKYDVKCTS